MITTICYFFSILLEAMILWQYTLALFVPKRRAKTRLALLFALYFILFAISPYDFKWLNALLYLLANFIFLVAGYRLKWHSALFHSSVLAAVMAMCELAIYSIIGHFAPHFFMKAAYFHNMILFAICSKLLFFTIIYILIHFLKEHREYDQEHNKYTLLLVFGIHQYNQKRHMEFTKKFQQEKSLCGFAGQLAHD